MQSDAWEFCSLVLKVVSSRTYTPKKKEVSLVLQAKANALGFYLAPFLSQVI